MISRDQNQGLQIAVIVFVILTVFATGVAVLTATNVRELRSQIAVERRTAQEAQANFEGVQQELDVVKGFIGMNVSPETNLMPDLDATKRRYAVDLEKYGHRLRAVQAEAAPSATYSQSLDAVLTVLEQRHAQLTAKNEEIITLRTEKAGLAAIYDSQVEQFRKQATAAESSRSEALSRLHMIESLQRVAEKRFVDDRAKLNAEIVQLKLEMQTQHDAQQRIIDDQRVTINLKNEIIRNLQPNPYVIAFDGRVTRVNAAAGTVFINVGSADQLQRNLRFGVQHQTIPPGGEARPKAHIEVMQILDEHLAECRIVHENLEDPILIDDNIYSALWSPGQRTHFAFAGRIDLDGDGGHDLERVRAMVEQAAGQIDCVANVDGEIAGALSVETRYLVLGAMPADASGKDAYRKVLEQSERYGVQRVSTAVFLDMIGYRRNEFRLALGPYENAGRSPRLYDPPDGGPKVSLGSVSELFQKRRPPRAVGNTAY